MADYDVIIIGAGPAGLTAGIYSGRARLKTLVVEDYTILSQAMLADSIENYPGFLEGINGSELIENFKKQAEKFDAEFKTGIVKYLKRREDNIWEIQLGDGNDELLTSRSVIIATGASPRKLDVPGEDIFQGRGVSYCATCDAAFYKDKEVVVVGGGDSAIEEALFLTRFAKKVFVVHRRDALRATKILQERAFQNKKIEFIWDSIVTQILGAEKVTAVRIKNLKKDTYQDLHCDGVFVFVGYRPNTSFVKEILILDKDGYIITDENMKTSEEGIFACGDCRKRPLRQIVTACGEGAIAAFSCQQYIDSLL